MHPLSSLRDRPLTLLFTPICLLLLLSALHRPDRNSPGFQLPGLLPSKGYGLASYPPGSAIFQSPELTRAQERRYAHLRSPRIPGSLRLQSGQGRYMFTTVTRNIQDQLPDLLNTLLVLTNFLGADRVYFSILEGPSDDATPHVLEEVLLPMLLSLGVPSSHVKLRTHQASIDFNTVNRIEALAELRNQALAPLWREWDDTVAIVYFNDVYLQASDVLELLHQHVRAGEQAGQETGITTGMDWWKKNPQYYYDIWVGRTMDGELFYPIDWAWWSPSDNLFPNSPDTLERFSRLKPFQVFSSWNGLAVLAATPFLTHGIKFRRSDDAWEECSASECTLIASDFWKAGYGRVQVVPSVQVAYERGVAGDILQELAKQKSELEWDGGVPRRDRDETVQWKEE